MPLVKKIWPDAEVIVRPGMEHCEAMAQVPDYVEKTEERITGSRPVMINTAGQYLTAFTISTIYHRS